MRHFAAPPSRFAPLALAIAHLSAAQAAPQGAPSDPGGVIDLERRYHGLDARWIHRGRSAGGPFTLTTGLAREETRDARRGWENFADATLGVQSDLRRDEIDRARSLAPYAQGQWVLRERWSASAGLRHTRVRLSSQDHSIVPGNGDDSGQLRYSASTPAAGLVFHAREGLNLYASWGRGFETPTLNEAAYRSDGTAGLNTALRPARSTHWEIGAKADPGTGWTAAAAYFEARTHDELVVLSNSGGRSTFQNASATLRRGIELSGTGRWSRAWRAQWALTWLDAHYRSGFLSCAGTPCTRPTLPVPAGNRIPGIPRASAFAELAWAHAPWGFEAAVEGRAVARVAVDDANSDFAPGYATLALRAGWRQQQGRWMLREFIRVDNLADRNYAGSVIVNEGNRRYFEPAPGRQWLAGASAAYRF